MRQQSELVLVLTVCLPWIVNGLLLGPQLTDPEADMDAVSDSADESIGLLLSKKIVTAGSYNFD